MGEPWARHYEPLSTPARTVLTAFVSLRLSTVSTEGVQALRGPSSDPSNAVLAELTRTAWLRRTGEGWTVPDPARSWLATHDHATPPRADGALERFVAYLQDRVTNGPEELDAVRGAEIAAAVRARARTRPRDGVTFAAEVWRAMSGPPPAAHQAWWQDLAAAGEAAAVDARLPDELIDLLWTSGNTYAAAGELFAADRQWRRAFLLADRAGDRERSADLLLAIGRRYRATRWLDAALTAFHELVSLRKESGDDLGRAEALTELAVTLTDAGRGTDAKHYLDVAGSTMSEIDARAVGDSATVTRRAAVLVGMAAAWHRLGGVGRAMTCYSAALAALIDVDDAAAEEVRVALAAVAAQRDRR